MLLPGSKKSVGGSIPYFSIHSFSLFMIISAISYVEGGTSEFVYFTPRPPPTLISLSVILNFSSNLTNSFTRISISSPYIRVSNI